MLLIFARQVKMDFARAKWH